MLYRLGGLSYVRMFVSVGEQKDPSTAMSMLSFLANADSAGLVLGARVPVILTSRADSVRSRIASCAVAVLAAHARRRKA